MHAYLRPSVRPRVSRAAQRGLSGAIAAQIVMAVEKEAMKPIVWFPTRIHPESWTLAQQIFDCIEPSDPRAAQWPELCSAAVLRTGCITRDEMKRTGGRLKIVTRNGVGYDNVPIDLCKELGVRVTNLPGSNKLSVSELVVALALSLVRRVTELDRRLRRGEHLPNIDWMSASLDGKIVGLVGQGEIAYETAKRFVGGFGTKIVVFSPTSSPLKWTSQDPSGLPAVAHTRVDSLEALLRQADIVSLHCPLGVSTLNMISTKQLAAMKKSAILVNTARGGLIDEPALLKALQEGTIAGAALDVVVHEPASPEHYAEFYALENLVITPHAGGGTDEVQRSSCTQAVLTAHDYLAGRGVRGSNIVV